MGEGQLTVAFWVKVASTSSYYQLLLGCGALSRYTGLYLRYRPNTKNFWVKAVHTSGIIEVNLSGKIKDTLMTWSHITVQFNEKAGKLTSFVVVLCKFRLITRLF